MIAEIAAGISGAGLLAGLGSTIYFAVKHARAVEHAANVQIAQAHVEGELTRAQFEIETLRAAYTESQRRNRLLAEAFNAELARASSLAPDDVAGRMRRFEVEWSTDAASNLPAEHVGGTVFVDPAATTPRAGELPAEPATELR